MDNHSVKSTVALTVTVSGMLPTPLQNFITWTYFVRTLEKHSILVTMYASIYEKELETQY